MDGQEFINRIRAAAYGRSEPDPLGPARDRYSRPRLEPGSRTRSTVGQVAPMLPLEAPPSRAQQRAEYDAAQRSVTRPRAAPAYQPPSNQFAEAGQYALEQTGLPAVRRSARGFASGDMETGIEEGAMGALGVGTLLVGGRGARSAPDAPPMRAPQPPTRIYRGIVPDESRRSALGDRWWSDNPETASTYAPATADGAHVVPGLIDESGFLAVEAPPGTMFRSIPVSALPPEIRRAFPRTTQTVSTHEVAAAAESQGYRGVTFSGIRDGGYGGSAEPYGGFQTGDDGRVIAVFDDSTVRSPFPTGGALRPPPRQFGTASDGSVMPVRPPEPFRQSMVGGSDDLAEAARPGALRPAPDGSPPRPQPSDGGSPEVGRPLARLREQGFDTDAPLYRGHDGDPSTGHWRASEGMNGEGVYMTRDPASAERWALRQAENEPTVHAIYARGRIADSRDGLTFEEAREQGYSGLDYYQNGQYVETVIFDPINVSPSVSRRALSTDGGSPGAGGVPRNPSDPLASIAAPGRTRPTGSITDDPSGLPPEGLDTTPSVSDPVEMRMERARRMGFGDAEWYHGTDADVRAFDPNASPPHAPGASKFGHWMSDDPSFAENYGGTVMPLRARLQNPKVFTSEEWGRILDRHARNPDYFEALRARLQAAGHDGVVIEGRTDRVGRFEVRTPSNAAVFDPSNIRSRFAAFDPARSNSRDLLAGIAAPAAVGGALSERRRQ